MVRGKDHLSTEQKLFEKYKPNILPEKKKESRVQSTRVKKKKKRRRTSIFNNKFWTKFHRWSDICIEKMHSAGCGYKLFAKKTRLP